MSDVTQCRSCGARVYWLKNATTGLLAPIDAEPVADGNVTVDLDAGTYALLPKDLFLFEPETPGPVHQPRPRHKSHFATCTDPAKHRKPRRTR